MSKLTLNPEPILQGLRRIINSIIQLSYTNIINFSWYCFGIEIAVLAVCIVLLLVLVSKGQYCSSVIEI